MYASSASGQPAAVVPYISANWLRSGAVAMQDHASVHVITFCWCTNSGGRHLHAAARSPSRNPDPTEPDPLPLPSSSPVGPGVPLPETPPMQPAAARERTKARRVIVMESYYSTVRAAPTS